jgi:acetylornithine deacetylase
LETAVKVIHKEKLMKINEQYLLDRLIEFVKIDSRNPSLTPGAPGEGEMARSAADNMRDLGLEVAVFEPQPGRPNVVGILKGSGGGKSLLLNAHMDTVGFEGMEDPMSAELRDGRLYGRGSQDMKGSLAAMLAAVKALVDGGVELAGDVIVTAVSDEEYASIGSEDVVNHVTADAAIVTEPTDMRLCRAHRGFIWYEVKTLGRAAHGSRYREGIDANMRMGRFLAKLDKLEQELRQRPPHPLAGPPSLHASLLQGGTELSVYAAECSLKLERRTTPGETADSTAAELGAIIQNLTAADNSFRATVERFFERPPFEVGEAAAIVKAMDEVMAERLSETRPHVGATFWTDAAIFAAAGMETVLLGPVGEGLHSAVEWVDVGSLNDLASVLAGTCVAYCGD